MLSNDIQKSNIDLYLKELAKSFRKLTNKNIKAEIIIVGGGSIIINYNFRMSSVDIDAFNTSEQMIKEASKVVAEKYNLSCDWLNNDFKKTKSYSPKLRQYSIHYKTYSNVLEIRTITREYLIAMKMVSARKYKHDLSDILGILYSHYSNDDIISFDEVEKAVINLYDSWDKVSDDVKEFVKKAIDNKSYIDGYTNQIKAEKKIKTQLVQFEEKYPNVANDNNVDEIIKKLTEKN